MKVNITHYLMAIALNLMGWPFFLHSDPVQATGALFLSLALFCAYHSKEG